MLQSADFYLGEFMNASDAPDFLVAYAQLNDIPFMVVVHLECGAVGVMSVNDENEKIIEKQVVPWLDRIGDAVHQKLLFDFNLKY